MLMDSGSSQCLIHHSKLPKGCVPELLPQLQETQMMAGDFKIRYCVHLDTMHLPEFSNPLKVNSTWAYIFDAPC
jgi:hypothetical protein